MNKYCLAFLLITLSIAKETFFSQSIKEVQIVLLAGQSNMAGARNYDELSIDIKQRIEKISNRVLLSFNGKIAKPLSYFKNISSKKYPFTKRFGPELLIGLKLAEKYPSKNFLLIKRTQGGTSLNGAWSPNWTPEKARLMEKPKKQKLMLYKTHQIDIKKQITILENQNKTYKIIGLFWMQGENDATSLIAAKSYFKNLKSLVSFYRVDFENRENAIYFWSNKF